jgi:uncharacterized repeat protein (TIGR03803 family)
MQLTLRPLRAVLSLALGAALIGGVAKTATAQNQEANLISVAALGSSTATDRPASPRGDLLLANDGNFYIATYAGGSAGVGAIARISPAGVVTVVHSLSGASAEGRTPYAKMMQASDGNLYGTTYLGGTDGRGTVFRVSLTGDFATVYSFKAGAAEAILPYAGLVQASDGNLYGTTLRGGTNDKGAVFRLSLSGTFTVLHSFAGNDGENPEGTLIVGPSGDLFGTTLGGGSGDRGTVFRVPLSGTLTSLYSFPSLGAFSAAGVAINATGANPRAGLLLATDGNFYGTAYQGGADGYGTVFRMTTAGAVSVVHAFTGASLGGAFPLAGVTQDVAGDLFGTTERGGPVNQGSAWRISSSNQFRILHGFQGSVNDGSSPYTTLVPLGGFLYGASYSDSTFGTGAIFKLDVGSAGVPPVQLSVAPIAMTVGATATLTWSSATAASCTTSGAWTNTVTTSGNLAVTPTSAGIYTYVLSCADSASVVRNAYASLSVNAPVAQTVDGGGGGAGGGSLSISLLLLLGAMLAIHQSRIRIRV